MFSAAYASQKNWAERWRQEYPFIGISFRSSNSTNLFGSFRELSSQLSSPKKNRAGEGCPFPAHYFEDSVLRYLFCFPD